MILLKWDISLRAKKRSRKKHKPSRRAQIIAKNPLIMPKLRRIENLKEYAQVHMYQVKSLFLRKRVQTIKKALRSSSKLAGLGLLQPNCLEGCTVAFSFTQGSRWSRKLCFWLSWPTFSISCPSRSSCGATSLTDWVQTRETWPSRLDLWTR